MASIPDSAVDDKNQVMLSVELGHQRNRKMRNHTRKLALLQLSAGEPITLTLKGKKEKMEIFYTKIKPNILIKGFK